MAFSCKKGSFAANTATGNQAVTGVGFQPKAIIFFYTRQAATGPSAGAQAGIGFTSGSTSAENVSCTIAVDDNAAENAVKRQHLTASVVIVTGGSGTTDGIGVITSFDSDGFTINWTTALDQASIIHYMALGGSDLTNAKAGSLAPTGLSGANAVTGIGFQPDFVMFAGVLQTGTNSGTPIRLSIGAAKSSTNRLYTSWSETDSSGTTNSASISGEDRCYRITNPAGSSAQEVDFVSMDADGFTLDHKLVNGNVILYIALKGGRYGLGVETSPTSNTTKLTTPPVDPSGVLFWGRGETDNSTVKDHLKVSIGAASSATDDGYVWAGSKDNVATAEANSHSDNSGALSFRTEDDVVQETGSLDSFGNESFTLSWSKGFDTTSRYFNYISFGASTTYTRASSDNSHISDSLERNLTASRATSDSANTSDSLALLGAYARALEDSYLITESSDRLATYTRVNTDAFNTQDSLARILEYARAIDDALEIDDLVEKIWTTSRDISDALEIDDSVGRTYSKLMNISDALNISDVVARTLAYLRVAGDDLGLDDSVFTLSTILKSVSDGIELSDSLERNINMARVISDLMGISDATARTVDFSREIEDDLELLDTVAKGVDKEIDVSDSIEITDDVSRILDSNISISDSIELSESIAVLKLLTIQISDLLEISETASRTYTPKRKITDGMELTELLTKSIIRSAVVSDELQIEDVQAVTLRQAIVLIYEYLEIMDQLSGGKFRLGEKYGDYKTKSNGQLTSRSSDVNYKVTTKGKTTVRKP